MRVPFRLGFFTHVEGNGDPAQIYQDTLELFVAADQLGFDVVWVAEHHFRAHPGRLPSLFPFLAAAAERTRRLRLGTSIVILPLNHPLRVAEDAAVVDLLSGGRLELGVGSGGAPVEFEAYGVPNSERHPLTTNGLRQLQRALRGEILPGDRQLDPPAPTLAERLWQSALGETGARYVAEHGVGLLLARAAFGGDRRTDEIQLDVANAYLGQWAGPSPPRIGLSRGIYPATDRRAALEAMRASVMNWATAMAKLGQVPGGLSLERYCELMHIAYGHPDEVAEQLAADLVLPTTTDLILQFNPVIPSVEQALCMLEQIATQIAPALGWRPALPIAQARERKEPI